MGNFEFSSSNLNFKSSISEGSLPSSTMVSKREIALIKFDLPEPLAP